MHVYHGWSQERFDSQCISCKACDATCWHLLVLSFSAWKGSSTGPRLSSLTGVQTCPSFACVLRYRPCNSRQKAASSRSSPLAVLFCQVRPSSTSKGALVRAAQPARPLIFAWQHQQRASSRKTAPATSATFRQARSDILQVHPTTTRVALDGASRSSRQKAFLKLHRARTSMAMDGCMDG